MREPSGGGARGRVRWTWVVLLLAAGPGRASTQVRRAAADVVLTGGLVFTADSTHPWAEAIAVRGERIVAVGTSREIRALAGVATRDIPLAGRLVVPGFNDAHDHVGAADFGTSFLTTTDPTPDFETASLLDSLARHVTTTPRSVWLHAAIGPRGLGDHELRRAALDRVAPHHPVMLMGYMGHGIILNSTALRRLGIGEDARDPLAGRYERDAEGRLTGAVEEYAGVEAQRRLTSALPTRTLVAFFRQYAADALRHGVTSVQDMDDALDPAATARVLRVANLPIRIHVIPMPMTDASGRRLAEWRSMPRRPSPRSTVHGVKWILDGSPLERGAAMRAPYADQPGWNGRVNFPVDTIRAMLASALAGGDQLALHVSGDSTTRLVLALMRSMAPDSAWRPRRVRIEHGDWMSPDLLATARQLGLVIVENPTHFAIDPALLRARFGEIPAGLFTTRSVLVAQVPLAIGSDGPANPFLNLMLAVTHPINPGERLSMDEAVRAYTAGSAYAEFAERTKGTLMPGMLADLAVLSQDIFTVPPAELPATTSVLTMVGGRVAFDALTRRGRARVRAP